MSDGNKYFEGLNEAQRMAVEYDDGPSLVIAGAGSGKTRVLTCRIVHLLNSGVEPWRIVALTFTNKAANEMRERIETMVGTKTASRLWMGTFHSIFLRILRINAELIGFKSNFTIYDAADSKSLIKTIIKDMGLDDKVYKPSTIQNNISTAKNALISPEAYSMDADLMRADKAARRPRTHEIYKAYRTRCFVAGVMDFDDILYYMNTLLRDNPDVLNHWQEYFKYVLVDEYQDTNFAQHLIVSRLTEKSHRFCVVGDDAQSIYSFRGANIRNILNLKKTYPDLCIFKLEQNYRSTQTIVSAANSLIKKNKGQIDKNVFSKNDIGSGVEVVGCHSDLEEAAVVVNRLRSLRRQTGNNLDEFAILYRTNAQSRVLEEQLRNANLNYVIYGGLSFYQRKEIKDAVAYFRLAVNPDDDEALRRVINVPARGIGETTVNKIIHAAHENGLSMWGVINDPLRFNDLFNKGTWKKIDGFAALVGELVKAVDDGRDALEVAKLTMQRTGLISMLMTENTPENITRRENLEELIRGAEQFVTLSLETEENADVSMSGYLSNISLATDQDNDDATDDDGNPLPRVRLMTVHAAKGLEFNNVFIVGVEDDLFPSAMSKNNIMEIEEERRLLYVALTRAKNFCMMSFAKTRFRNGQTIPSRQSPFISDIDPRYLKPVSGTEIGRRSPFVNPEVRYRESFHSTQSEPRTAGDSKVNLERTRRVVFGAQSRVAPSAPVLSGTPDQYTTHNWSELTEGMIIEHRTFGRGVVRSIDSESPDPRIKVKFENYDEKTLLLKFAHFKIIE